MTLVATISALFAICDLFLLLVRTKYIYTLQTIATYDRVQKVRPLIVSYSALNFVQYYVYLCSNLLLGTACMGDRNDIKILTFKLLYRALSYIKSSKVLKSIYIIHVSEE